VGNVGFSPINQPFWNIWNGFYKLFMMIWGMVYYCFTHMIQQSGISINLDTDGICGGYSHAI
jgi:hypothetical protein